MMLGEKKPRTSRSARGHAPAYEYSLGSIAVRAILTQLRMASPPQRVSQPSYQIRMITYTNGT